jgi:hypothetical protein
LRNVEFQNSRQELPVCAGSDQSTRPHRARHVGRVRRPSLADVPLTWSSRSSRPEEGLRHGEGHAFIFPASGTGAQEAAITNTLSPGDKVLAQRFGQFSHLWIDLCKRQGLEVIVQEREWAPAMIRS